ncbi:MAG TPA: hypothetical protein VNA22_03915 [Pyrinomonadaceae bacterium]|nr:hypothetical protein [Pyrinomonadaceae bacterium]
MSGSAKEWVIVIVFFLTFFAATLAEAKWLNRNTAIAFARAFTVAFIPNVFTVTVGFAASAVVFGLLMMLVADNAGVGGTTVWSGVVLSLAAPLAVLFFAKRFTLLMFRLEMDRSPWLYSFLAAVLFLVAVVLPAITVAYFI